MEVCYHVRQLLRVFFIISTFQFQPSWSQIGHYCKCSCLLNICMQSNCSQTYVIKLDFVMQWHAYSSYWLHHHLSSFLPKRSHLSIFLAHITVNMYLMVLPMFLLLDINYCRDSCNWNYEPRILITSRDHPSITDQVSRICTSCVFAVYSHSGHADGQQMLQCCGRPETGNSQMPT